MPDEVQKKKRGRPKGVKNKRREPIEDPPKVQRLVRDPVPKKTCICCQKSMSVRNFYRSYNEALHPDGYMPYCKECVITVAIDPESKMVDVDKLQDILRQCDRPWDERVLDAAFKETDRDYNSELDTYERSKIALTKVWRSLQSLPQYRMSWSEYEEKKRLNALDEALSDQDTSQQLKSVPKKPIRHQLEQPIYLDADEDDAFEVTPELVHRFGSGYTKTEYRCMAEKYAFLIQSYPDISNLHTEALVTYIRYKVKEELATSAGDVDSAEKWANLATKAADKAKINPSQLKEADLQNGLNSFSEIFQKVEQAKEILDISPFMYQPNDAPDMILYLVVAYMCSALGKPQPSYEEVYKFYDDRVAEYLAKNPSKKYLFKKDPSKKNRKEVASFIDISE